MSCAKKSGSSHAAVSWSSGVAGLLRDTAHVGPVYDSLRRDVLSAKNDTLAIRALYQLAEHSSADRLLRFASEAGLQSERIGYEAGRINAVFFRGVYHYKKSAYDSALACYDSALVMAQRAHRLDIQAASLARKGEVYYMEDEDAKAYDCLDQGLIIAQLSGDHHTEAFCLGHIGEVFRMQDKNEQALEYYGKAMKIATARNDREVTSYCLGSMGDVFRSQGNYSKSLDCYQQSLAIARQLGAKYDVAYALSSIGDVNRLLQNFREAIDYYLQALDSFRELNDNTNTGYCLSSIGDVYRMENDFPNALKYSREAEQYMLKTGDKLEIANCLSSIGAVFSMHNDYDSALKYLQMSIDTAKISNDKSTMAYATRNIADIYFRMGKQPDALRLGEQGMQFAQETRKAMEIKGAAELLFRIYEKNGDYKKALDMHKLFVQLKDSINSNDQVKKFAAVKYKAKEEEMKAGEAKKDAEYQAERIKRQEALNRQKTIAYAVSGGLLLVVVLAIVILRSLRQSRRDKAAIEQQKHLIEEKQKEILDSITYAKRLQEAILPPGKMVKDLFPESFVLYLPKDIVAGDFYFLETSGNSIILAAADCTGHGVPGAMVSVVCSNALTRAVREFGIASPEKILDKVRELVIETFEKSEDEVKDGMDISLVSVDLQQKELKWSGAHNPLWYLRDGAMHEIKANKQPVGRQENSSPFTAHTIDIRKGDIFYLFTDGFADQFGGPKGKKFRYRQMEELLISVSDKKMEEQRQLLENAFREWKGGLEQVDDVCIIGVKFT
ncbi:MAG TPA: tetratricopeptide repeat protein [Bacteroidia bacterium]|nr:tetratricopeptide repeat protein [Bacteroidia bacterium]